VTWYGLAGYARYQIDEVWAVGLRAEIFHDEDGVPWEAGYAGSIGEGTLTLEARPEAHLILRLEARHDEASSGLYETHDAAALARAQTTMTLAGTLLF
jgi:hypothetical protein